MTLRQAERLQVDNQPNGYTHRLTHCQSVRVRVEVMETQPERELRKLTRTVHQQLVYGVRHGLSLHRACVLAGITMLTFERWRQRAENGHEAAQRLVEDIEQAQRELEEERRNAVANSRRILESALVTAAYRKVEALNSDDERTAQSAATEILDRFHGKPVQSVNANVTAQAVVKGYIGISPDEWDSDSAVQAAGMADSAVA